MDTTLRPRTAGIDAVRVLGIAAVIFGHVFSGRLTHEFIYAWHVPVFFFLTGYLWTHGRSLRSELGKRGRALALPYVGWFVLISVIQLIDMSRTGAVSIAALVNPALGGSHAGGAYGTFWFVSVLFFTAVFYRMLDRLPRWAVWAIAVAGLLAGYLFGGWLAATPLAIGSTFPCLIFLVAGTAARQLEKHLRRAPLVGAGLIVVPLLLIAVLHPTPVDIKNGLYGTPVLGVLFACALAFGPVLVAKAIPYPRALGSLITELAVVGIAVVLSHLTVLTYARLMGAPAVGIFLLALVIPWAVALLLHRTPLSPVLIGSHRRSFRRTLAAV